MEDCRVVICVRFSLLFFLFFVLSFCFFWSSSFLRGGLFGVGMLWWEGVGDM